MKKILVFVVIAFALWAAVYVPVFGWHYVIAEGEHTGYVTAVENEGLFVKTPLVYFKTDTESSQEDLYCASPELMDSLRAASVGKVKVTISYEEYISNGIWTCGSGSGVIINVR